MPEPLSFPTFLAARHDRLRRLYADRAPLPIPAGRIGWAAPATCVPVSGSAGSILRS